MISSDIPEGVPSTLQYPGLIFVLDTARAPALELPYLRSGNLTYASTSRPDGTIQWTPIHFLEIHLGTYDLNCHRTDLARSWVIGLNAVRTYHIISQTYLLAFEILDDALAELHRREQYAHPPKQLDMDTLFDLTSLRDRTAYQTKKNCPDYMNLTFALIADVFLKLDDLTLANEVARIWRVLGLTPVKVPLCRVQGVHLGYDIDHASSDGTPESKNSDSTLAETPTQKPKASKASSVVEGVKMSEQPFVSTPPAK
ncbi:uncharacterized protein I206_106470 [Kwoniella pini CBS 10737]|uniref:Uncharacterized protein n=1 Tax=Kwoniella pini CBS 10737 TaxID=1296096 RepID=A0A1B9HUF0_9TREE|nr:uncharacterized protein I206_07275 [Kwoniella pini CBS 10737]OCF46888.1 hypothetical protein I206_07275 [Kwoniella pini CBS 10737]